MARRKIIQIDHIDLLQQDNADIIHVCLTQQQIAVLKALLVTAYWQTRWNNLQMTKDELEAYVADIEYRLDGGECSAMTIDFRENPLDYCEVQYSTDGGTTWITMFRKDNCVQPSSNTIDITQLQNDITTNNTNITNYAGDITNVAPGWQYENIFDDRSLCFIIYRYVNAVCDIEIAQDKKNNQELRDQNDWLNDVADIFASTVVAAIAITAGTMTIPAAVWGAISWASVQIFEACLDYLLSYESKWLYDEDGRKEVMCWMYNKLRGDTPQFDKWQHSLDDYTPTTYAAEVIAGVVAIWNSNLDVYVNYMMLFNDLDSIKETLPECECPQPVIIDQLNGLNDEKYGTEFTSPTDISFANPGDAFSVAPGVYMPIADQYNSIANPIGGQACNVRVVLPHNVLVRTIKVEWTIYRPSGSIWGGDKNAAIWVGQPGVDGVYVGGRSGPTGSDYVDTEVTTVTAIDTLFVTTPRTHVYIHNSTDREDGYARISWIHIECVPYTG